MAVTIDLGEARNIHPRRKQEVGRRLAQWALAKTYGKDCVASGPLYRSMRVEGDKILLEFDHAGDGLAARGGGTLEGFVIAGADLKFVEADAKIVGATVVVSSPEVKSPAAVRYAWADIPQCNLVNRAGLPASPFRTDTGALYEGHDPEEFTRIPSYTPQNANGWKVSGKSSGGGPGRAVSPPFRIDRRYLNFLFPRFGETTPVCLRVDGQVVRTSGSASGEEGWRCWDVNAYRGRTARFEVIDQHAVNLPKVREIGIFLSDVWSPTSQRLEP